MLLTPKAYYILSLLNFIREQFANKQTPPLKTSKKFTLVFTRTLSQTVAGDILARSKDKTSHEVKP